MNCTIRVAKTKALISFAVTAKLICTFVFAYTDCWFSQVAAQINKQTIFRNYTQVYVEKLSLIYDKALTLKKESSNRFSYHKAFINMQIHK